MHGAHASVLITTCDLAQRGDNDRNRRLRILLRTVGIFRGMSSQSQTRGKFLKFNRRYPKIMSISREYLNFTKRVRK